MHIASLPENILRRWRHKTIPMVIRTGRKGEQLFVHLPFAEDNRLWVNSLGKSRASYSRADQAWNLPKTWLNSFIGESLNRYGSVYVVQPHNQREVCAPACRNATGHECQCSCLGAHHGAGDGSGWFDVSEIFAFRWAGAELAIRKLSIK